MNESTDNTITIDLNWLSEETKKSIHRELEKRMSTVGKGSEFWVIVTQSAKLEKSIK